MGNFSRITCILIMCSVFSICASRVAHQEPKLLDIERKYDHLLNALRLTSKNLCEHYNITKNTAHFQYSEQLDNTVDMLYKMLHEIETLTEETKNQNSGKDASSCFRIAEDSFEKSQEETYGKSSSCTSDFIRKLNIALNNISREIQLVDRKSSKINETLSHCTSQADLHEQEECLSTKIKGLDFDVTDLRHWFADCVTEADKTVLNIFQGLKDCFQSTNQKFSTNAKSIHEMALRCISDS